MKPGRRDGGEGGDRGSRAGAQDPARLRQRAEALAREQAAQSPEDVAALSPAEIQRTLHELQVHQVELELQNEELRRAQGELDVARLRYFDLYDLAPVGYCTLSEKGLILQSNLTAATILGRTRDELIRRPLTSFVFPADQDAYYHHRRALEDTGRPQACEVRMLKAGDATIWARLESSLSGTGDAPREVRVAISDVTEHHALREGLAQADRLASMGVLAAGVAHEINNPLTFVLHEIESLARDVPLLTKTVGSLREALRERAGDVELARITGEGARLVEPGALRDLERRVAEASEGTERIAEIARGLSSFSRVERAEPSLVDPNRAVENAVVLAKNEIRFRAVLEKDLGAVPRVLASEGKLTQVFLNLLLNAAHAMEDEAPAGNRISVRTWRRDDWVLAEVADTGRGIPPESLERVFETFFTTKEPHGGTGLGLPITRRIVGELGGDIRVESTLGEGTRFVVSLPVARGAPGDRVASAAVPCARGRILVVDDEDMVRRAIERLLREQHDVVAVGSGRAAQEMLERDTGFDVVLCDLMMPDVSGIELHGWLLEHHPRLARHLAFITGGVFTTRARDHLAGLPNVRIEKPFDAAGLREIVSGLLSAARNER